MRLLCVDDEADLRPILELALSLDPEFSVAITGSADEFLARAREGSWDAFVLDGMMPGVDGFELCRRVKADPTLAGVPVVFLTAKTHHEDRQRAQSLGAVACLMKPFDPLTLARELRDALAPS